MARASESRQEADGERGGRRVRKLPRISRKVFHRKRRGPQGARNSRKPQPQQSAPVTKPSKS